MEINIGNYKLRFDPNEIRVNIDGEKIDIGARNIPDELPEVVVDTVNNTIRSEGNYKFEAVNGDELSDDVRLLDDNKVYKDRDTNQFHKGNYFKRLYSVEDSLTQK